MRKIFHILLLLVSITTYSQKVVINQTFTSTEIIDLANKNIGNIYTAAMEAQITLNGKNSLARILFVDEYDNEILVTELFYPLYLPGNYDASNIEELSKIKGVSLRDLKIVLVDASVHLNYIQFFPDAASSSGFNIPSENTVIQNKINQLNVNLSNLGYLWRANINEDNYYYSDRNQMPTDDILSYGFGYYDRGIFAAYPPSQY